MHALFLWLPECMQRQFPFIFRWSVTLSSSTVGWGTVLALPHCSSLSGRKREVHYRCLFRLPPFWKFIVPAPLQGRSAMSLSPAIVSKWTAYSLTKALFYADASIFPLLNVIWSAVYVCSEWFCKFKMRVNWFSFFRQILDFK